MGTTSMGLVGAMMRVTTLKASAEKLSGLLAYYAGLAEDRDRPGLGRGPVPRLISARWLSNPPGVGNV